ncbi:hypothetical protein CDG81_08610 [Actinopolyspora erythraea]|uniref:Uncharacterized protein n=1 Tax=Actinopolyspora erythraea TaxID=414996 RepID=A0A099D7R0_9ACTN|nr:hypothetical protein CDG81_08610 [Actinopolyspora erythraea]KGI81966.1 hypothetical protein IL38_08065 [Actinopolyspora erythraea]
MEKLTRLINELDRAADHITATNRALSDARGRHRSSGGDNVSEEFRGSWSHGTSKVAEDAKAVEASRTGGNGRSAEDSFTTLSNACRIDDSSLVPEGYPASPALTAS